MRHNSTVVPIFRSTTERATTCEPPLPEVRLLFFRGAATLFQLSGFSFSVRVSTCLGYFDLKFLTSGGAFCVAPARPVVHLAITLMHSSLWLRLYGCWGHGGDE